MIADYDQLLSGLDLRAQQSVLGRTVDFAPRRRVSRHAWQTTVTWSPKVQQWQAQVAAGYVNGDTPIWRTDVKEQAARGRDFGTNPLTGQPYFSSFVFPKDTTPAALRTIDVPLYDEPVIPLSNFRDLGEAAGDEIVPTLLTAQTSSDTPIAQRRQLRAVDLVLHQPRVALTSDVITGPGLLTGTTLVHQSLTTRPPQADDTLRVLTGTFRVPEPPTELDALEATYTEQAYDELLISTVYFLSPPGTAATERPDLTWRPAVKHALFWNLSWIPAPLFRSADVASVPNPIVGLSALGNVLVAPFVNTFAAEANDIAQGILNQLRAKSQAGTWWTPTGGGHVFTPPPVRVGPYDPLDKAARNKALAVAKAREAQRAQAGLDPSFPYTAIGFPATRFDV